MRSQHLIVAAVLLWVAVACEQQPSAGVRATRTASASGFSSEFARGRVSLRTFDERSAEVPLNLQASAWGCGESLQALTDVEPVQQDGESGRVVYRQPDGSIEEWYEHLSLIHI